MVEPTSAQRLVKPLQFVENPAGSNSPGASPSFTAVGPAATWDLVKNVNVVEVPQWGSEDLFGFGTGLPERSTTMNYMLQNSTLLKYALNAANWTTPAGTIAASITILASIHLNGTTEYFIKALGTRANSVTYTREIGKPDTVDLNWRHTDVPVPSTAHGLTTPTFVTSFPSGTVWDWLSGGANPLSWGSTALDCKRFTVTVERNTSDEFTLGNTAALATQPHARRVKGSFTNIWTSAAIETDYEAGTERTLTLVLKTSVSTMTITNAHITSYKRSNSASSNEAIVEECEFDGVAISVT